MINLENSAILNTYCRVPESVQRERGLADFLPREKGFQAMQLGFYQWKTATGNGIAT